MLLAKKPGFSINLSQKPGFWGAVGELRNRVSQSRNPVSGCGAEKPKKPGFSITLSDKRQNLSQKPGFSCPHAHVLLAFRLGIACPRCSDLGIQ